MSPDGRLVAWQSADGLVLTDVTSRVDRYLTRGPRDAALAISTDNLSVLHYSGAGAVRVARTDGFRPVLEVLPAADSAPLMSGDGRVVFAWSGGALVRVDVMSGRRQVIVPAGLGAEGWLVPRDAGAVEAITVARGGLLRLSWQLQPEWNGGIPAVARFGSESWPIVYADRSQVWVRAPADAALDPVGKDLQFVFPAGEGEDTGPFERVVASFPWKVAELAPTWLWGDSGVLAAHGDWRGLVTAADPARPGELLHLYATGLGNAPLTCFAQSDGANVPAEVLWYGEAPSMPPGLTQVNVRVPEVDGALTCRAADRVLYGGVAIRH